jgi:DNA polymerase I-like protein with 3'-5' exonuclease and polymerase domains
MKPAIISCISVAESKVRTLMRCRKLPPPKSEDTVSSRFSAVLPNMAVQGTCADGLKQAMVQLADKLPDEAHIIGTVHDELIGECPTGMAEEVCRLTGREPDLLGHLGVMSVWHIPFRRNDTNGNGCLH